MTTALAYPFICTLARGSQERRRKKTIPSQQKTLNLLGGFGKYFIEWRNKNA
jgi:hypothetical protein